MDTWILLRGLTREASHWGAFAGDFQTALPQAKVVALDLPGNGQLHALPSPLTVQGMVAACRAELARQGVLPPFHLFAMSLGAMVATEWARTAPEEISGCVLVNTSFRPFSPFFHRLRPRNYAALLGLVLHPPSADAIERTVWRLTSNAPGPRTAVIDDWVAARTRRPVSAINALRQLVAAARYRAPTVAPSPPRPAAGQPERPFGEQPLFTGQCRRVALRPGPAPRCRARPAAGCAPVGDRAGAALVGAASPVATANAQREITPVWDDLHNPRASVVVRIGMGRKASFAANSPAIGKKSNAVDRPRPRCHRPQGVMQVIPCATRGLHAHLTNFIVASPGATTLPSHSPWRSP